MVVIADAAVVAYLLLEGRGCFVEGFPARWGWFRDRSGGVGFVGHFGF